MEKKEIRRRIDAICLLDSAAQMQRRNIEAMNSILTATVKDGSAIKMVYDDSFRVTVGAITANSAERLDKINGQIDLLLDGVE